MDELTTSVVAVLSGIQGAVIAALGVAALVRLLRGIGAMFGGH